MKRIFVFILGFLTYISIYSQTEAIDSLASRVTQGSSKDRVKFKIVETSDNDGKDWFRILFRENNGVLIEGNNLSALGVGLNHFLKYIAKIHISWNNTSQKLPDKLEFLEDSVYRETDMKERYYLNYCTFSYSMPFWDEERWLQEIDWMALHGINLALSITGNEVVWKILLEKYGYSFEEICEFIPGPAYMSWWQMNNLEGWGGPLPEQWFDQQQSLQQKIVSRMKSLGINPIMPGYAGMVPRNFEKKTGVPTKDVGTWCGFSRPGFVSAMDTIFNEIAQSYYEILEDLYGKTDYYAMDPFHEGGDVRNLDLNGEGMGMFRALKAANPEAKWVIQSWQANPRKALIDSVPAGELIVLDLYSEKVAKWKTPDAYGNHDWLYCMLLNFGGNIGMHGRFNELIEGFDQAKKGINSSTLKGIGATPEGIENNPIMYELLFELPWSKERIDGDKWLENYLEARYGRKPDKKIIQAWKILKNTVYDAPVDYPGEGTVESIICARPSWNPRSASTWGNSTLFYSPDNTMKAKELMQELYEEYAPSSQNFIYDFIDISRQANADEANRLISEINKFRENGETDSVELYANKFLDLLLKQDKLLKNIPIMNSLHWIEEAAKLAGDNDEAAKLYKENAAMLITVWGDSKAANEGGLHDYSHREWAGIIRELYYPRWKAFFDHELYGAPEPDYYKMETDWVKNSTLH